MSRTVSLPLPRATSAPSPGAQSMQSNHAPPLVVVDLAKAVAEETDSPFELHPMLTDLADVIPY